MTRNRRLLLSCLAAAISGALWGAAFATTPRPWLGWIALAPLLALLASRSSQAGEAVAPWGWRARLALGFAFGLAAWLTSIPWIWPTLVTFGKLSRPLGLLGLLVLSSYLAVFHALFALWAGTILRAGARGRWGAVVALAGPAALWVALEWLRAHLFSGFPWNPAAHAWTDMPGALPASAWVGAYGISFLLVLANGSVAALVRGRWRAAAIGLAVPLVVLVGGGVWGGGSPRTGSEIEVRVVQPNIPNLVEVDWPTIHSNYRGLLELTREACDDGALVLWPESAAWPYALERDASFRRDVEALAAEGCGILLNSAHPEGERWFNSVFLVSGDRPPDRYDKRHLVPFGEYVPLGDLLPFIQGLARAAGSFAAADEVSLLRWADSQIGSAICFEIVFPEEVAELSQAGAGVLVTVTNDAWYGDTAAPRQHFRAARWRAAENRRPVLRAAITGISGVIEPDGSVAQILGVGERGVLRARVAPRLDSAPYSRAPWLVPLLCSLLALFAIFLGRSSSAAGVHPP